MFINTYTDYSLGKRLLSFFFLVQIYVSKIKESCNYFFKQQCQDAASM